MRKNPEEPDGDDEPFLVTFNGAACRTPDEDVIWEE